MILCGPTRSVSGSCGYSWRSGSDFRAEWRRSGEPGSSARWSEPLGLIGWRRGRPAAAKGSPPHTESWSRNKGRCPGSKERSRSSSSEKSWQPSEPTAKPCRWRQHTIIPTEIPPAACAPLFRFLNFRLCYGKCFPESINLLRYSWANHRIQNKAHI